MYHERREHDKQRARAREKMRIKVDRRANKKDRMPAASLREHQAPQIKKYSRSHAHYSTGKSAAPLTKVMPGISHRFGPVEEAHGTSPVTNGTGDSTTNSKRKSRSNITQSKNYKEASEDSEDDQPLVSLVSLTSASVTYIKQGQKATHHGQGD